MNPVLAQLYGTGFEKQASDEIDLNQISGAQLLELMEMEEQEKYASEGDIDLSQLSGRELLELYAEAEEMEEANSGQEAIEKMAADGSLDFYDMAGRIMAHAHADEMSKIAYDDDDELIEVDLDNISGEDLAYLMDEGYEFIEKTAGRLSTGAKFVEGLPGRAASAERGASGWVGKQLRRGGEWNPLQKRYAAAGEKAEKAVKGEQYAKLRAGGLSPKRISSEMKHRKRGINYLNAQLEAGNITRAQYDRMVGRRAVGGAAALGAAGAAGTAAVGAAGLGAAGAAGGAYYMKKKKKGPWAKGGRFNR